jgi:hypothetical protein
MEATKWLTVALFDRPLKGVIAPSNEEYLQSLSTVQLTRARALRRQTTPESHVCTIVYARVLRFHRNDCFSAQTACLIAATNMQRSFDRDGHGHRPMIVATMIGGEVPLAVHSSHFEDTLAAPLEPPRGGGRLSRLS